MKTDSKQITGALTAIGFTPNEAAVYVTLLKKLELTAFEIAKLTGIPRATVYLTLESLKKQGIISQFRKNNVAYFSPENPNQLMHRLKEKERIMNEIMPQILAITSAGLETPTAKLHTGIEGLKVGLEDILETLQAKKIKQIFATSQPDMLEVLPKYFPNWLKRREELGVFTKLILPASAKSYLLSNELREIRYLPASLPFDCSVTIYDDKMAFFSAREDEPYCVILESRSITTMLSQFFAFTWGMLGREKPTP